MSKVHNFSAGPAILPQSAIDNAIDSLKDFAGTGLPLITVSHRGKEFVAVMDEAVANAKELLGVPEGYSVLYLQGGASLQFYMVALNLLGDGQTAAYLNTGTWASKAIKEAKLVGNVQVVASSEEANFNYIPKEYSIPADAAYFHITTNNTIFGTQIHEDYEVNVPLVADMSSDIYSRPVDVSKYDLIYAGAQKNIGPAGATLVIVKDEILNKIERKLPSMLDYRVHIKGESMYNTPPVFAIFVINETFKWLKSIGGVAEIQKRNIAKATLLYNEIDRNPLFKGAAVADDRSLMNVTFVLNDSSLDADFLDYCKNAGISGIKGHRSVGGFRASLYNALELESVQALVDVMKEFESKYA
ncbi:3-phosphoserine/phosphohydroxythreonine transaminase [bacterium]|nr:3-phosphoserine/phosphohydroxythreonine transaminase [bacterium]